MANELAYGFVQYAHLADERVETVGVSEVYGMISASLGEYNRQINALLMGMVQRTTDYQVRVKLPGGGTLQPLDESGNPLPVREEGYYDVAFPIQGGGTAFGANRVGRALMTVAEANRRTLESMRRDKDWMRRHILAAVLDNAPWTYEDEEHGNLTIQPLANGDTVTYLRRGGDVSTDTHYLAQAAAIDDSNNPFDDIYDELIEHPSNMDPVVVYVPTNLKPTVVGLTSFVEVGDPDLQYGSSVTRIQGNPAQFDDTIRGFGDAVLGKVEKCWIVEWKALPSNYMIAHARGAAEPVLKMREYPAPELQGFFMEQHSPDGNLNETRMIRYAGFGVHNRVGALVYRIGNVAYGIPTGYGAPLSV
jgi:hypothetical protein